MTLNATPTPDDPGTEAVPRPLAMPAALAIARAGLMDMTGQPPDAVVAAERAATGWRFVIDVIEGAARMGDNDLLSAYEIEIDGAGEMTAFRRIRRYHREDREG